MINEQMRLFPDLDKLATNRSEILDFDPSVPGDPDSLGAMGMASAEMDDYAADQYELFNYLPAIYDDIVEDEFEY